MFGVSQISPVTLDGDSECQIRPVVHQVIAAIIRLVEITDVVEADVPRGVLLRHLRALPYHFHRRRNDCLDYNLAGSCLASHALLTPAASRIWRPIRNHPARSCANAKKAHTPITDIYNRMSPGTAGGSMTIPDASS